MSISIVIVDDHPDVRLGLKTFLLGEKGFHILGEGENGYQAISLAKKLQPNVMILDINMPELSGLESLPIVVENSPLTRVIMFSNHSELGFVGKAFKNGAYGYVDKKPASLHCLVEAIHVVSQGERYISPSLGKLNFSDLTYAEEKGIE